MNPEMNEPQASDAVLQPQPDANIQQLGLQALEPTDQPVYTPAVNPASSDAGSQATQPLASQLRVPQKQKSSFKKKIFIILGIIITLIIIGGAIFSLMPRPPLVGPLVTESYEGLTFKRPASWENDMSLPGTTSYHPKRSAGNDANDKPTYEMKMAVCMPKRTSFG